MTDPAMVAHCLRLLWQQKVHRTFSGYLCIQRTATAAGRASDLQVDFKEFFETFLAIEGGPEPYIVPFTLNPGAESEWQNPNVAGSYAPSSLRGVAPLRRVVEISGRGGRSIRYALREGHASLAKQHLSFGERVNAVPLAVFLYRDYALVSGRDDPSEWLRVFQEEFGYLDAKGRVSPDFKTLYSSEWPLD